MARRREYCERITDEEKILSPPPTIVLRTHNYFVLCMQADHRPFTNVSFVIAMNSDLLRWSFLCLFTKLFYRTNHQIYILQKGIQRQTSQPHSESLEGSAQFIHLKKKL